MGWVVLLVSLAVGFAACGTVDPGPETGPPAGCDAPGAFFVSDVWPKYFDTYSCGKSDCHDASSGHGYFRLQALTGVTAPQPTDPISSWPAQWISNLMSVQHNLDCGSPLQSAVLTVPSGLGQPHPPGVVVTDVPGANALFSTWLK